jgi:hypothetical protein
MEETITMSALKRSSLHLISLDMTFTISYVPTGRPETIHVYNGGSRFGFPSRGQKVPLKIIVLIPSDIVASNGGTEKAISRSHHHGL